MINPFHPETENITVIIPSYNRAHLLNKTIPTYFQPGVREVIIIDDCSTDNTSDVVKQLQLLYPGKIRYFCQPQNMKQTAAKNKGIELCETTWIYFGDDDSILIPESISKLYATATDYNADIVGARALYMRIGEDKKDINDVIAANTIYASKIEEIIELKSLTAHFNLAWNGVLEVPFCHACMLIKTQLAKKILFDPGYIGNAYREETDFVVRCSKIGAKIMYNSEAIQYNLPPTLATGGARGKSVWKYKWYCIRNNWRFLKNNWEYLMKKYNIKQPAALIQFQFTLGYLTRPLIRLIKQGRLKTRLQ